MEKPRQVLSDPKALSLFYHAVHTRLGYLHVQREKYFDPWNEGLMVGIQAPLDWLIRGDILTWEGWGRPL